MRKIIVLIAFFISTNSFACDICGCANSGSFFGILPQGHQQFMGIKLRQNSYDSHIGSQLLKSNETFQTAELWGRFYPLKKIQIMVFVPLQKNVQTRSTDNFKSELSGLGDASLLIHFNVLNTFVDTTRMHSKWNHQLMLVGGIKVPTGASDFNQYDVSEVANINFQLGTGSFDVPLNAIYTINKHEFGVNLNVLYKLNSANNSDYKFANQTVVSLMAFRSIYIGNSQLMPSAGLYADLKKQDLINGIRNVFTGGYSTAALVGLDLYAGKYGFNTSARIPLIQNLSNGELKINSTLSLGLSRIL
jgi:hypothetical protein